MMRDAETSWSPAELGPAPHDSGSPNPTTARSPKMGMSRLEMTKLVLDLARLGYCNRDVAALTNQCPSWVKKTTELEGLEAPPKPGRMVTATDTWMRDAEGRVWGAVYLEAFTRVMERDANPHYPIGKALRDATRIADWRFGVWDAVTPSRRGRLVMQLSKDFLANDVVLRLCPECGFRYFRYRSAVAVDRARGTLRSDCPCCDQLAKGRRKMARRREAQVAVRATVEDLFAD